MTINKTLIMDKFTKRTKTLDNLAYGEAYKKFKSDKESMLEKYDEDAITQELNKTGFDDEDPAGILEGRSGNLRALLGFESSDTPASDLRSILDEEIRILKAPQVSRSSNRISYKYPIEAPNISDLYQKTPNTGWNGSWLRSIEKGITGLKNYLFRDNFFANSRSGKAIQSKNIINPGVPDATTARPYVSNLLAWFKNQIKSRNTFDKL